MEVIAHLETLFVAIGCIIILAVTIGAVGIALSHRRQREEPMEFTEPTKSHWKEGD